MNIEKKSIRFYASAKAVITLFLHLPGSDRIEHVIRRVDKMTNEDVTGTMEKVKADFESRHRNVAEIFLRHFDRIAAQFNGSVSHFSPERKLLLGAFFTKEYSIQAAALFNPSIVPHPDQQGLQRGQQRFVMSLRATGEGHISSIVFKTGVVDENANIVLDKESGYFTCLQKNAAIEFDKQFIVERAQANPGFDKTLVEDLPGTVTARGALDFTKSKSKNHGTEKSVAVIDAILDTNYELDSLPEQIINEIVIFPNAKAESMGMEDTRFVKFEDAEKSCYYGTYTAYDGKQIKTQLIETTDFSKFKVRTLYGAAVSDKGMALFPEKINGRFAMISRQGGENMYIMYSDDLYRWETSTLLMEPLYTWELVQLGNCGSPVKTKKGWLLLTHGVGVLRTYVISAILLDLENPERIIGRLNRPLIEADASERDGYVPNVVYTCGYLLHNNILIIPYAVSDSATGFATIRLDELFDEM